MAKELPYFKFEPAEYLTKDVSFCSLAAQGLFINLCSYYWQRGCNLSKEQFLRRLNHEMELNELIQEGVIDVIDNHIYINFLDVQFEEVVEKSRTNKTNGSKGGRPVKNRNETEPITETKPNVNPNESESKGIREDKIRVEEIKEDKKLNKFNYKSSLMDLVKNEILVSDYIAHRNKRKASNSETAFNLLVSECDKHNFCISEALKMSIERNWTGFKVEWTNNNNKFSAPDNKKPFTQSPIL